MSDLLPPCQAAPAVLTGAATLRIGYVPLLDAAPLVVADAMGFFAEAGLRATVSAERAWATIRDKLAFGALDAAHLLAPMAVAAALGLDGIRRRLAVTANLARNGNTVTLSHALAEAVEGFAAPLPAAAFAAAVHRRAEDGLPPPTLAVVFAFSSHNYLLRHWLASGGLDPDADLRVVVVPPPQVARALAEGAIEGFCAGEPWGSQAVALGAGRIALATADIWPGHPEKVLAFAEGLADRHPGEAVAATAAVIRAQRWLTDPANREAAAALLHERVFPDLAPATVARALGAGGAAPGFAPASCPFPQEAGWWFAAMRRWGHLPRGTARDAALAAWRPELWAAAAALAGEPAPPPPPPAPFQPEEPAR